MPNANETNRRTFVRRAGMAAAVAALRPCGAFAASYAAQYPDMLVAHMVRKVNAFSAKWDEERARIQTPAEILERNRFVREKSLEMIHGLPPRCPLAAITVATHERAGYRVENVMFQSLPDFWITGNLYVPAGPGPFPAVISPCGHYPLSRMEPEYQAVYIDMVKAGLVVLAYDPIGQGERRQYWSPRTGQSEVPAASTFEHSMPGQVLLLMGEDLTHYRVWDGMRAIDYLQSRPDVNPARIGCAGHSGGGTLTMFISALDERVQCAVVNEGGTAGRWPLEIRPESGVGPADVEQNLFPAAKYGIDAPDLHIAIAPRPLLVLIEQYSPRFDRAAERIRQRYGQLGEPDRFRTEEANDPHSWTPKLRLASTRWLCQWLARKRGPEREADFVIEPPETLYCTPSGSLRESKKGESIFTMMAVKEAGLRRARTPAGASVAPQLAGLLRFRRPEGPLETRLQVTTPRHGYSVEKVEFLSEPDIFIPAWVFIPEKPPAKMPAVLVCNEAGKEADGMEFGFYEKLAHAGKMIIACDVRGVGETKPPHNPPGNWPGEFRHLFDVETAIAYMAWSMDQELIGMRVADVIRAVDYAHSRPDVDLGNLQVLGQGAGALWVLFAAVLDSRISRLICERGLLSYGMLAQVDRYRHSAGVFVRDILTHFDLPEIAAALSNRSLTLVSPVDHLKRSVPVEAVRRAYATTEDAFAKAGRAERFRIATSLEI